MSFWTVIGKLIGLVPDVIDAGTQIAEAVKPVPKIDPADSTLWHTMRYWDDAGRVLRKPYCTVCQKLIPEGLRNQLCDVAVQRRQS